MASSSALSTGVINDDETWSMYDEAVTRLLWLVLLLISSIAPATSCAVAVQYGSKSGTKGERARTQSVIEKMIDTDAKLSNNHYAPSCIT